MKIRNGFVSNSSSSSFIILYKDIDFKNITEKIINDDGSTIYAQQMLEYDVFIVDDDIFKFLKKNKLSNQFWYRRVYGVSKAHSELTRDDLDLLTIQFDKGMKLMEVCRKWDSCKTIADIENKYKELVEKPKSKRTKNDFLKKVVI